MSTPDVLIGARAVVFDAYGTLLDVHSAVQRHAGSVGSDAKSVSDTWRQKQLEYSWVHSLCGRYTAFWTLTERALDYALARHPDVDPSLRPALLEAYRRLDAYPEVSGTSTRFARRGSRPGSCPTATRRCSTWRSGARRFTITSTRCCRSTLPGFLRQARARTTSCLSGWGSKHGRSCSCRPIDGMWLERRPTASRRCG